MEKINFIDPKATIGGGGEIGHFTVIEENVHIGKDCRIGSNVVIREGSVIGDGVLIDDGSIIGKKPMRAKRSIFKDEKKLPPAEIDAGCTIGALAVVYRGCRIANDVFIADTAAIRENVSVGEYTIVGRGVTIENFTQIGKKCKLETGCYITAYSEIDDYCFIAPMVCTTNDNYLGRTEERFKYFKGVTVRLGGRIGANATILPGKVVGKDAGCGLSMGRSLHEKRCSCHFAGFTVGPIFPKAQ